MPLSSFETAHVNISFWNPCFKSKFQVYSFVKNNFTWQYISWLQNKYSNIQMIIRKPGTVSLLHKRQSLPERQRLQLWIRRARSPAFTQLIMIYLNFDLSNGGKQGSFLYSCVSHRHVFPFTWNSFKIYLPNIISYMWKRNKGTRKSGHRKRVCLVHKNVKYVLIIWPRSFCPG